jgi:hypothetical protein
MVPMNVTVIVLVTVTVTVSVRMLISVYVFNKVTAVAEHAEMITQIVTPY